MQVSVNNKNNETDGDYLIYVLNENNKYITTKFIQDLLMKYNIKYNVKDLSLFQTAMVHTSYLKRDLSNDKILKQIKEKGFDYIKNVNDAIPLQDKSYETLEFLGDSVIHLVLASYLRNRYPDQDEGFCTKLRTKVENGTTLASLAHHLGLHEYVLIARNIEYQGGREKNEHIFEDTFEAFLGALFEDSKEDYELCKKFIINVIEEHIDISHLIYNETNYKDSILQYYHQMRWCDPEYKLLETIERDGKKYFRMCVTDSIGCPCGEGIAGSKKKAEQIAAHNALLYFKVIKDNESDDEFIYDNL